MLKLHLYCLIIQGGVGEVPLSEDPLRDHNTPTHTEIKFSAITVFTIDYIFHHISKNVSYIFPTIMFPF